MKIVLQRVAHASVTVEDALIASIGQGLLLLLGVEKGDDDSAVDFLADKVLHLRIFSDENGKMNRSVQDIQGGILVVSQFTLAGDCQKGRRPGFDRAALPDDARKLYQMFLDKVSESGLVVGAGEFGADMKVELLNDGPVTFILER